MGDSAFGYSVVFVLCKIVTWQSRFLSRDVKTGGSIIDGKARELGHRISFGPQTDVPMKRAIRLVIEHNRVIDPDMMPYLPITDTSSVCH